MQPDASLAVENLAVSFDTDKGRYRAVDGVSFHVRPGKTLAIVGESGCGKTVTALTVMGLLPENARVEQGTIAFEGRNLVDCSGEELRRLRGRRMAMIFQEPMTALNPVFTVGQQIMEVFRIHEKAGRKEARIKAVQMLEKVRIPDPEKRIDEYPFQMSGGMRQRALIAIALACSPALLFADEPTTALDVSIQAQVLRLMRELQKDLGTSIVFITHDLGVVADVADDVVVMYAGRIVEHGTVFDIFDRPRHPYTRGLLHAVPTVLDSKATKLSTIPGLVPSIYDHVPGCRFNNRCPFAEAECRDRAPRLEAVMPGHEAACHFKDRELAF